MGKIYAGLVGPKANPTEFDYNTTNLIDELLKVADLDLGIYRDQYMIAANITPKLVNSM